MRNYKKEIRALEAELNNAKHPTIRKRIKNDIQILEENHKARTAVIVIAILSTVIGIVLAFGVKLNH